HHTLPHSRGGPTSLRNLVLLCPEHHILTHQHQHDDRTRE
ncbi:HNH endonuclease, partial [Actinospica sp. MGRD01-02]|nr:HNH endonuclease [Actinospica acidithermotolerans]